MPLVVNILFGTEFSLPPSHFQLQPDILRQVQDVTSLLLLSVISLLFLHVHGSACHLCSLQYDMWKQVV